MVNSSKRNTGNVFEHVKIEHLFAGISGGVTSTIVLHPLDLLKIRFAGNVLTPFIIINLFCKHYFWFQYINLQKSYQVFHT